MRVRAVVVLLVVAATVHSLWMLEFVLGTGLSATQAFVSELAARGEPFAWLYRSGDAVAGGATALAALWWPLNGRGEGFWVSVGWWSLLIDGVAVACNAVLPLDCPPSKGWCRAREQQGLVSLTHHGHQGVSLVASGALLAMMLAFAMAASRRQAPRMLARGGWPLFAVCAGASVAISVLYVWHHWLGLPQRVQLLGLSAWLVLLAASCPRWKRS